MFDIITELPSGKASNEQLERMYQRYKFALDYCQDKDVLEIACGGGMGLGLLAQVAKSVVGSDIEEKNLTFAEETYKNNDKISIIKCDALDMPFSENKFDTILIYEAIYYFNDIHKLFTECNRVLKPGGHIIIVSANKEWKDFNPSKFSQQYYSVKEIDTLLNEHAFESTTYKGFTIIENKSLVRSFFSLVKRVAVKFNLIPKSFKLKQILKRIVFGKLKDIPNDISSLDIRYFEPEKTSANTEELQFKVIFAVGTKK